jgi:endoglycosylceramidase
MSFSQRHHAFSAALTLLLASALHAAPLRVDGGRFIDQAGGDVVLRGFNLSGYHKLPPFRPNQDPDLFKKLTLLGVNAVRLQFNWEAFEPQPGVYDESYLDYYAGVVARAAASNIYVLVDIHQDAFSRWALDGCGEGFPRWAMAPGVKQSTPDDGTACKNWSIKLILQQAEQSKLVDYLITPGTLPYTRYMGMLDRLSARFATTSNVIGYDLYNEPAAIPDARKMASFYQAGAQRVRASHSDAMVFIEPEATAGTCLLSTPLKVLASIGIDNAVYAPHYYDTATLLLGLPPLKPYAGCAASNRQLAKKWGMAVLLGEYGVSPRPIAPDYIDTIYTELEKAGESGMQWNYTSEWTPTAMDGWNAENLSVVDDKGQLRSNFRPRPYVQRTAGRYGKWESQGFSVLAGTCLGHSYTWSNDPDKGSTNIFFPTTCLAGRSEPSVNVQSPSGAASCTWLAASQQFRCVSARQEDVTINMK